MITVKTAELSVEIGYQITLQNKYNLLLLVFSYIVMLFTSVIS